MNIHVEKDKGTIHEDGENCKLAGASMMVFSVDPTWGNMYFWLGKEKKNIKWPEGSETWSDFGGRPKDSNEKSWEIASREFLEETCGTLKYAPDDTTPIRTSAHIAKDLRDSKYLLKMVMWTTDPSGLNKIFVTYVKQIPWQPEGQHMYSDTMVALVKARRSIKLGGGVDPHTLKSPAVQQLSNNTYMVNRDFMEKDRIRMWSIPALKLAIGNYKESNTTNYYPENYIGHKKEHKFRKCFITMVACVLKELTCLIPASTMSYNQRDM